MAALLFDALRTQLWRHFLATIVDAKKGRRADEDAAARLLYWADLYAVQVVAVGSRGPLVKGDRCKATKAQRATACRHQPGSE